MSNSCSPTLALRLPGAPAPIVSAASAADVPRFLSQEMCRAIIEQLRTFGLEDNGQITMLSRWRGDVRWARNRIQTACDWRDNTLRMESIRLALNQVDAVSLRAMVECSRARQRFREPAKPTVTWRPVQSRPQGHIWSDATYAQEPGERSTLAAQLVAPAEQAGMLSAGYICVEARGTLYQASTFGLLYAAQTIAQCSLTVRDPQGTGSGWAGASSYDWSRIDAPKLAAIALDKCLRSRNPVKLEPARYTTILEPQATFELLRQAVNTGNMDRSRIEGVDERDVSQNPFRKPGMNTYQYGRDKITYGNTRLGEQVFDARLTIRSDPLDPELGTLPFTWDGYPYVPVTWVEHGVLTTLAYHDDYAQRVLHEPAGKLWSDAFRIDVQGPPVSMEEMIATTTRGLLVTRFTNVKTLFPGNVLCTGLTRDGLWLIENGKISHPVQNFRFTQSVMLAFNSVEQIGQPVPVFNPECPAVVPAVKVREFNFTAMVDAI